MPSFLKIIKGVGVFAIFIFLAGALGFLIVMAINENIANGPVLLKKLLSPFGAPLPASAKALWEKDYWANFPLWVQAGASIIAATFGFLIFYQLSVSAEQLRSERDSSERSLYLPLMGIDFMRTKRFCAQEDFKKLQDSFFSGVFKSREDFVMGLGGFRTKVNELLREGDYRREDGQPMSLDDIEYLISYYTYLCKLMRDKKLRISFATELGRDNFINFFKNVRGFIEFRRSFSDGAYAKAFWDYCTTILKREEVESWKSTGNWPGESRK